MVTQIQGCKMLISRGQYGVSQFINVQIGSHLQQHVYNAWLAGPSTVSVRRETKQVSKSFDKSSSEKPSTWQSAKRAKDLLIHDLMKANTSNC